MVHLIADNFLVWSNSVLFRSQNATIVGGLPRETYAMAITTADAKVFLMYIDADGSTASFYEQDAVHSGGGAWQRWRVTWWEGRNLTNDLATVMRIDKYVDSAWVEGTTFYDTNRRHEASATNMVAVTKTGNNAFVWYDDCIISQA